MIVLDASVIVRLYLPEPDAHRADTLIGSGQRLLAPSIIQMEVTSAIVRAVRHGRITPDNADELTESWIAALEEGALDLLDATDDLRRGMQIALQLKHRLPDCLYLALAERLDVPLVTADMAFHAKAAVLFPRVAPLSSI